MSEIDILVIYIDIMNKSFRVQKVKFLGYSIFSNFILIVK